MIPLGSRKEASHFSSLLPGPHSQTSCDIELMRLHILASMLWGCVRLAVFTTVSTCVFGAHTEPVDLVNPLIGTKKSAIGYGGTMPFVTPPFGMTDWTPQTRQNKISVTSYNYDDPTISGFIGTHQPAIWMGDYGYVTIVPQIGALKTSPEERKMPYSHAEETAAPDYYAV